MAASTREITNGATINPLGSRRSMKDADRTRLAELLSREFGAPAVVFDDSPSLPPVYFGREPNSDPSAFLELEAAVYGKEARPQAVSVWPKHDSSSVIWLLLPLEAIKPGCFAAVGFQAWPRSSQLRGAWGPAVPQRALLAWGRETLARLLSADSRSEPSSEALAAPGRPARSLALHDRLTSRLRVSDPPEMFQRLALSSLRDEIGFALAALGSRVDSRTSGGRRNARRLRFAFAQADCDKL